MAVNESTHGREQSGTAADQIERAWGEMLPVIEKLMAPPEVVCPAPNVGLPAPNVGLPTGDVLWSIRRHDQGVSDAIEPIKAALLEVLDSADLPPDDREQLRRDLQRPEPYLEPVSDYDFSDAAGKRNSRRLARLAKVAAALGIGQPGQVRAARLRVNLVRSVITLDGTEYAVTKKRALYVHLLVRAQGRPVSNTDVVRAMQETPGIPEKDKKEFRVTWEREKLPSAVRNLIDSDPGSGSWLLVEKLA
jgi:hypothetical protein